MPHTNVTTNLACRSIDSNTIKPQQQQNNSREYRLQRDNDEAIVAGGSEVGSYTFQNKLKTVMDANEPQRCIKCHKIPEDILMLACSHDLCLDCAADRLAF